MGQESFICAAFVFGIRQMFRQRPGFRRFTASGVAQLKAELKSLDKKT
jgi:hypothetical protein